MSTVAWIVLSVGALLPWTLLLEALWRWRLWRERKSIADAEGDT